MAQCKPKSTLEDLLEDLEKQEHCDIFFQLDGKTIGAHKLILKLSGQALYEMASEWSHSNPPIPIEEMSYDDFSLLLRYIYSGEIPITKQNIFPFMAASKTFEMKHLEDLCTNFLIGSITVENVCTLAEEAVNFNSEELQKKCMETFSKQTNKVTLTDAFYNLTQPALAAFLEAGSTNVLEVALFWCVKLWMERKCKDAGIPVNGPNMRRMIGDALYKIHFPTMTGQDFANSVTTIKGLLTESEIAQVFQKIMVLDNADVECPFPSTYRCERSHYGMPVADIEELFNQKILVQTHGRQQCDTRTLLTHLKDTSSDTHIGADLISCRIVLQCFADLTNSSCIATIANYGNATTRKETHDAAVAWMESAKTENVKQMMTKFMEMRQKLNRLCKWDFN